jgi:hypothetical protein
MIGVPRLSRISIEKVTLCVIQATGNREIDVETNVWLLSLNIQNIFGKLDFPFGPGLQSCPAFRKGYRESFFVFTNAILGVPAEL